MEEELSLDLLDLVEIIRKRIKLISVITIISVAAAAVLSYFVIKPSYEVQTTVLVGRPEQVQKTSASQYNDVMMYQNLTKTYTEIAKSRLIAEKASERLGGTVSSEVLQKSINVTPKTDTQILVFKAVNNDPQKALDILTAVADTFVDQAKVIYPTGGSMQILDRPMLPKGPVKPRKLFNIAIAFLMSLMASVGLAFLLEYIDNTIKTEADVERYLEVPVIGIIPKLE